jgi:hypothetical protein
MFEDTKGSIRSHTSKKGEKLRRAEGGAKIFGVFRVKIHDFTPIKHITESPSYLCNVLEIHCSCAQWFLDFSLKAGWRGLVDDSATRNS